MANTPSNRQSYYPPISPNPKPSEMALHLKNIYTAINNHDAAIDLVNQKTSTPSPNSSSGGGVSTIVTKTVVVTQFPGLGAVNPQTGVTAYTVQTMDNGALVLVGDSSAVAVTLNSALTTPYFVSISNSGTSTATLTPSSGTINGAASLDVPSGSWVTVYFDNVNWTAESPGATAGGVTQIIAGTNVTISPVGGMGAVTVNATSGAGGSKIPHVVTGSRSFGSVFQNTTGTDMWVSGFGTTAGGVSTSLSAYVDTPNPPVQVIWANQYGATTTGEPAGFGFWVPDTYFYEVIAASGITGLGLWVEYF